MRGLFDIPDDITYLNCAYMSPQLNQVRAVGQQSVKRKSEPWKITAKDFFEDADVFRALCAQTLGASADGLALVPSVSYGMATAAANLSVGPGREILILANQFPSNVYPWLELAKVSQGIVRTVPRPVDDDWTRALLEEINPQTAIVAVPNCHWTDGGLIDLVRVSDCARSHRAALVVDATQSLGVYPFDFARIRPDFLVAASYKWMFGPYSMGLLYVDEKHRQGTPIEFSWTGRRGSEQFSNLEYQAEYQPGAQRFDVGEKGNFVSLPMAIEGMKQIQQWGVSSIQKSLRDFTSRIAKETQALGIQSIRSDLRAGHIIGLKMKPELLNESHRRLAEKKIFVSVRGTSIRVSPHLYNTEEDITRLVSVLSTVT